MHLLVTGGAGFIGTHTLIELYKAGHTAVVVDNLSNSNPVALQRVEELITQSQTTYRPFTDPTQVTVHNSHFTIHN
ncbi:MAG: NAD-dependent epimerase/dehydratase family protein, partial [Bacteroidales bacterium]|nr:NAD-dependent epimerase/dehydratase family protein [Bacteroidales bacterium]